MSGYHAQWERVILVPHTAAVWEHQMYTDGVFPPGSEIVHVTERYCELWSRGKKELTMRSSGFPIIFKSPLQHHCSSGPAKAWWANVKAQVLDPVSVCPSVSTQIIQKCFSSCTFCWMCMVICSSDRDFQWTRFFFNLLENSVFFCWQSVDKYLDEFFS